MSSNSSNDLIVLWDHSCSSAPITFNPFKHRGLTVLMKEKVISLGCRYLENNGKKDGFFLGSIQADKEGIALVVTVDRFEENSLNTNQILPGDIAIPFVICKIGEFANSLQYEDEVVSRLKKLREEIGSRIEIDLGHVLHLSIQCKVQGGRCEVSVFSIANNVSFKALSIPPIPIYKSALQNILTSQLNEATHPSKSGLLTIDSNRKVNLISDADPRVSTTSIVGLWVSSVNSVEHPYVWASCLRYISCTDYTQRLCLPPKPFLLIIYSSKSKTTEFYDCLTSNGLSKMTFVLLEGHDSLTIPKIPSFSTKILRIELENSKNLKLVKTFQIANNIVFLENVSKSPNIANQIGSNIADTPRSAPTFHPSSSYTLKPMVPDVSILSDHGFEACKPSARLKPPENRFKILKNKDSSNQTTTKYPFESKLLMPQGSSQEFIQEPPCKTIACNNSSIQVFERSPRLTPMLLRNEKEYPKPNQLFQASSNPSPSVKISEETMKLMNTLETTDKSRQIVNDETNSLTYMLKNQDQQLRNLQEQVMKLLEAQENRQLEKEQINPVEEQLPREIEISPISNASNERSNTQLLNMLQHQDEQLLKLQEQVKQMLAGQTNTGQSEIDYNKRANNSKCSIGVMTSVIYQERSSTKEVFQKEPSDGLERNCSVCECCKKSRHSGGREELSFRTQPSPLNLPDLSNCRNKNENSDIFASPFYNGGQSFFKANDKNPTSFYQKILHNVNQILADTRESQEDNADDFCNFRQMDSLYLPRLNYQTLHLKDNDTANFNEDFDELAQKYLGQDQFNPRKSSNRPLQAVENTRSRYDPQLKSVSFATKVYLDKHNLSNPSLIPEENQFRTPVNRVLNIEEIQRQPKLL